MRRLIAVMTVAFALIAGNAMAESIKGRLAVTGELGFLSVNNSLHFGSRLHLGANIRYPEV